ncbi:MAG TPA: LysE family translocator [Streptosporangiaceae bacterium]|nr:LysE family translocator [Streptosporangiaceae bacterium]
MIPGDRLLAFCALALVVIAIPGPSVLFLVGRALAHGRRTALASVLGNELGELALATLVALGLGPIVERSAIVLTVMKMAGAAYLIFLGVRAIRQRRAHATAAEAGPRSRGGVRAVADGFLVGVANPKTAVFFIAILPEFVSRSGGHVATQMLMLGVVFVAIAAVSDSAWSLLASAARAWLGRSPRRLELIGGAGGLAMIGLGVTLALTGRKD